MLDADTRHWLDVIDTEQGDTNPDISKIIELVFAMDDKITGLEDEIEELNLLLQPEEPELIAELL